MKDGVLQKDEKTWDLAVEMFEQFIRTGSSLYARDYIALKGCSKTYASVRMALRNESYKKFLDPHVWESAQKIIKSRAQRNSSKTNGHVYLFSGIIFCSECKRRMSCNVEKSGSKRRQYTYYRCNYSSLQKENCSHRKRIREETIEKYLIENMEWLLSEYNMKIAKKAKKSTTDTKESIKRKMEKLKDLYLSDLIEKDAYADDYKTLRDELILLEREEKVVPIDTSKILPAISLYDELTPLGKKSFWARILDHIEVNNNGEITVFFSENL